MQAKQETDTEVRERMRKELGKNPGCSQAYRFVQAKPESWQRLRACATLARSRRPAFWAGLTQALAAWKTSLIGEGK